MSKRLSLKLTDKNDWLVDAIQTEMDIQNRPSLNNVVENILVSYFKSSDYIKLVEARKIRELESKLNKDHWFSWDYDSDKVIEYGNRKFQTDRKVAWRGDIFLYKGVISIDIFLDAMDQNILIEIQKPEKSINDTIDYIVSETPFIEKKK